ncbi:MAG: hypothetical protein HY820_30560 [Acidobacteria bacterium]|nr:hypothetical protein [Acidobacteriota bacterium]
MPFPEVRIQSAVFQCANRTLTAKKLPLLHKDPFDLKLIAQAIVNNMTIVTPDRTFQPYTVRVLC